MILDPNGIANEYSESLVQQQRVSEWGYANREIFLKSHCVHATFTRLKCCKVGWTHVCKFSNGGGTTTEASTRGSSLVEIESRKLGDNCFLKSRKTEYSITYFLFFEVCKDNNTRN